MFVGALMDRGDCNNSTAIQVVLNDARSASQLNSYPVSALQRNQLVAKLAALFPYL